MQPASPEVAITDGRVLRKARNREAIVSALLELIAEGELQPTAESIAQRAQVKPRTVFRHFEDMAALHTETAQRVRAMVEPLVARADLSGSLPERVSKLVALLTTVYGRIAPYRRSMNVTRRQFAFVQADHEHAVRDFRVNLLRVLPEIRDAGVVAPVVELLLSFEAWDRLCSQQKLSPEAARRALEQAVLGLLGG